MCKAMWKKKKWIFKLNFISLVGFQTSKICMFFKKIYCVASFELIHSSLKVFHMVWKNQESGEPWLVGFFGLVDLEECRTFLPTSFFFFCIFAFLSHHYRFTTCFEILNSLLFNVIPRVVSTCRILHIATAWQILVKFWDESCLSLHHLKF